MGAQRRLFIGLDEAPRHARCSHVGACLFSRDLPPRKDLLGRSIRLSNHLAGLDRSRRLDVFNGAIPRFFPSAFRARVGVCGRQNRGISYRGTSGTRLNLAAAIMGDLRPTTSRASNIAPGEAALDAGAFVAPLAEESDDHKDAELEEGSQDEKTPRSVEEVKVEPDFPDGGLRVCRGGYWR